MIEQTGASRETAPAAPADPIISIGDFVQHGLEPGQSAMIWDFENGGYVRADKPTRPSGRFVATLLGALTTAAVHGIGVVGILGGLNT